MTEQCRPADAKAADGAGRAVRGAPRILFLATEDWAFCQHFLPMLRAARELGFEVAVAARSGDSVGRITSEGAAFLPLENQRGSLNPFEILGSEMRMTRIIRDRDPDILHCINIRMATLGGLAARMARFRGRLLLAPTGLGHLWIEQDLTAKVLRKATQVALGTLLRGPKTHYLFENSDDPLEFGLKPSDADVTIVNGAGVDARSFEPAPEPVEKPVKIALIARMLKPKGIAEAVAAVRLARERGASVELHLFGTPDSQNRRSFSGDELWGFCAGGGVVWHGQAQDPASVYRTHHIAILLSYREGLPKSLVEAAAIGRPIITSDVPGCRDVVRDGKEGFVVSLGNIEAAADAICQLAEDRALRERMGRAARERFEDRFTEARVMARISELYGHLLSTA